MRLLLQHHRSTGFVAHLCVCLLSIDMAAAESLVDPTLPYSGRSVPRTASVRAVTALQLEAILHGSQRRLAIINGQLLREGDRIGNSLIESITPTGVRYSRQGQQYTLSLAGARMPEKQLSIRPTTLTQLAKEEQP